MLDVANHAFAFAFQLGAAVLQAGVQLVDAVLGLFDVGGQRLGGVTPLLHFGELPEAHLLAVDEFVGSVFIGWKRLSGRAETRQTLLTGRS